jgi:putative phage-type endonuclease
MKADRMTFLEQRRRYLGGTDIPAILGLSPWASPLSVYLDKIGEAPERDETMAMRRGLHLERFIADEFCRARPGHVTYQPKPLLRTEWGFPAGAQIDAFVASEEHPRTPLALLECKAAFRSFAAWDPASGELPDNYYVQVQWQLAVADLSRAYAAADVGDEELRIVPIEADARVQERLIEAGLDFWTRHIEPRIPPEPDGSGRDGKALAAMWPETVAEPPLELEGDESAEELLREFLNYKAYADDAVVKADAVKQKLCALMAEHEVALLHGHRLTWKRQSRTTIDTKALRAAHPAIAEEFSRSSETRVFLCKEMKP